MTNTYFDFDGTIGDMCRELHKQVAQAQRKSRRSLPGREHKVDAIAAAAVQISVKFQFLTTFMYLYTSQAYVSYKGSLLNTGLDYEPR